jgi:LacI family transcriptional regulator, galactose operon repressor
MAVTLREVARAAGVSTASASRALARRGAVSEELRGRILAAAGRLGYAPNLAARALVARRSGLIGILAITLAEPVAGSLITALERAFARMGYGSLVATAQDGEGEALACCRDLAGRGVEAVVALGVAPERSFAQSVVAQGLPWLLLDADGGRDVADVIGSARRAGGILAVRYLLSLAHERFGVVAGSHTGVASAVRDALKGTSAALQETDPTAAWSEPEAAQAAAGRLLDRPDAPSAIICGSDLEAAIVLRELRARGRCVPQDASVVGFGDSPLARCTAPSLTTVRIPVRAIAAAAAESLQRMLEGQKPTPCEQPPVKIVIRESTGGVRLRSSST